MRLNIISIGHKMPQWVTLGFEEYKKRFPNQFPINLIEISSKTRSTSVVVEKLMEEEGEKILAAVPKNSLSIALDERGKLWNTQELAQKIDSWQTKAAAVNFFIGGPDGLSKHCLATANECWSLSPLTLPHPLVRVILIEQLYRAISILQNHPYHRA
jgi:23S rRNA (pseudouridine1915-N3)-methyltransferase